MKTQWYCDPSLPLVYVWSVLLLMSGASLVVHPWSGSPHLVSGIGLLACGAFSALHSHHVIDFFKMISEMSRLRCSRQFYRAKTCKNLQKLKYLNRSDIAFQEMDARFDGSMIVAKHDLPALKIEVREKALKTVSSICRLFIAPDPSHLVKGGQELRQAMAPLDAILRSHFPDSSQRCAQLIQALETTKRFRQDGGITCGMLSSLVGEAMVQEDVHLIRSCVQRTMSHLEEQELPSHEPQE